MCVIIKNMSNTKNTKPKKNKSQASIHEEVITTHVNADFDALASMIAVNKLYPDATPVFPGSQEKNIRNFFLHSTSYIFNIAKIRQIDLSRIKRLIFVDTRQKSRIGKFSELVGKKGIEIHIYDHHPDSQDDIHGDIEIISKTGSTTALLTKLIREKKIPITPEEATIMCLGIHEDTGSFNFTSTTADDYEAAAWLTQQGADHNVISSMLSRELTAEQVWLLSDLTKSATTRVINGVEVVITKVSRDEYVGDFAVLVQKLVEMENLNVVFALGQMADRIYLVARSRIEEVNVAEIASALGGGGHPYAASANIKNRTLTQVERSLQALLRSQINPKKTAKDMMSSPAIHISIKDTMKKAAKLMTRYNINVLLVLNDQSLLKGYITRQVVEKAVFLGLGDVKATEYMNIEFSTVSPDASLKKVQELIIRNRLRIIPVVKDQTVLGVISRTDLLNILYGEPLIPEFLYDSKDTAHLIRHKNMAALLKERLPRKIIKRLKDFGRVADMLGFNAYLVGGLVRDIILRRDNLDVDIVVEGDGIKFAHEFAEHYDARVRSHRKFGTAVLVFPDGFKVDVATARMEYYESPGAPPTIETSSIKLDLYRRDFTINTLAIRLNKRHYGTLIDYFGGQRDIKEKVLSVLHNLSFVEDPTRVIRAIRFEQRFGFRIGKLTLALIRNAVKLDSFKDPENRRLYLELGLMLKEEDPIRAIKRMDEFGLLQAILPEIQLNKGLESLLEEIRKVIVWHSMLYLEEPIDKWKIYWHGFNSTLDMKALKILADKMGMLNAEGRRMISQRQGMKLFIENLYKFSGDDYQLYKLAAPYDTESLLYIMAKTNSEKIKRLISNYFTKLKGTEIKLKGKDLSKMGFQSGPIYKEIFERVLEARLNNSIKTKEDEISFVKRVFEPSSISQEKRVN